MAREHFQRSFPVLRVGDVKYVLRPRTVKSEDHCLTGVLRYFGLSGCTSDHCDGADVPLHLPTDYRSIASSETTAVGHVWPIQYNQRVMYSRSVANRSQQSEHAQMIHLPKITTVSTAENSLWRRKGLMIKHNYLDRDFGIGSARRV